jgi:aspartyl/asparaginyl beta-hydroxylase (cupin superfamily)
LSKAISETPEKKQLLPDQITPWLERFENKLAKIRDKD